MTNTAKNIAKGISILGITGIVCKVIGLLFSIPLNNIYSDTIGANDVAGLFYSVYPTYTLLLTISSAGLPVAVSRLVAGFLARGDRVSAWTTFRTALRMLTCLGAVCTVLMVLLNKVLVAWVDKPLSSMGFYAIAPCVFIVCILSAYRGFIQGQHNMLPTAVTQLIEQVGKVIISLPLAYIGVHYFNSLEIAAAGALLGITVAELIALCYIMIHHKVLKKQFDIIPQNQEEHPLDQRSILRRLIMISIPITITACIIPLSGFIDSIMMMKRMMVSGLSWEEADAAYNLFHGVVIRFINIPTAVALAISMNLVPVISARRAVSDHEGIRRESNTGMRYAFLIGFPASVGMSLLSRGAVEFFYRNSFPAWKITLASELLSVSALTVILFTAVQATSSILQGIRRQKIPMYAMAAGVAVKVILNFILIGTPGINIHGGPIASIFCYAVALVINIVFVCRYTKLKFNWMDWLVRPGLATAVMGGIVYALLCILPAGRLSTIIEITAGVIAFIVAAIALKAISLDELRKMLKRGRSKA